MSPQPPSKTPQKFIFVFMEGNTEKKRTKNQKKIVKFCAHSGASKNTQILKRWIRKKLVSQHLSFFESGGEELDCINVYKHQRQTISK